jgi:S1-C subfamily serine protease
MNGLRIGAAVMLLLTAPSYAWSQADEQLMGEPMPTFAEGSAPSSRAAPSIKPRAGLSATRLGAVMRRLEPDARAATRGPKDVEVYAAAAPSVVLVVSEKMLGSGVLVAPNRIVTNLHVVGADKSVGVIFKPAEEGVKVSEKDARPAKVIRRDEVADLALLEIESAPEGVKPLALGDLASVKVGADVHAIGHPTGETWTYTRGIVSQVRKDYEWAAEDRLPRKATVIQTQTPINPGNSGGPLIDDTLSVVGLNTFGSDGEGLNFAVSADDVKAMIARDSDRWIDPETRAAALCESVVVAEERSRKPRGVTYDIDDDCDGEGNFAMMIPDSKRDPIYFVFDDDRDGKIDSILFDVGHDETIDFGLYDKDGDGEPDLRGDFRPGEDAPYRYVELAD